MRAMTCYRSAYKAIHGAIGITKTFAEDEDTLPLNVAMEFRFTKHSDSLMSPAYGQEVKRRVELVPVASAIICVYGLTFFLILRRMDKTKA